MIGKRWLVSILVMFSPVCLYAQPSSWDWRNVGGVNYVTSVKSQGQCRTCWAMAATAALESQVMKTYGELLDLSEQVLVSCANIATCGSSGSEGMAASWLKNSDGIPVEDYFPYDGTYQNVHACSEASPADWRLHAFKLNNYGVRMWTTVNQIKSDIYNYGPVMAEMYEYKDFVNYTGGIYAYDGKSDFIGGHVVVLIGYDDAGQYFIGKNSRGTSWGESGFFRMSYNQIGTSESHNNASINHQVTYFNGVTRLSQERYVSASGSGGDGSKMNPWGPSEIPWTSFESGTVNTFLYFYGGTYTNTLSVRHQSQTNRLYIEPCSASVYSSGCDGKVTFKRNAGNNIVFTNSPSATHNVTIDGEIKSGVGTRNIDIKPGELTWTAGVDVSGSADPGNSGIIIKHLYLTGTTNTAGPCVFAGNASGYVVRFRGAKSGSEISNCHFYNNWCHSEIYASTDDTTPSWGILKIHHNLFEKGSLNSMTINSNTDIYNNHFDLRENCHPYDVIHYYSPAVTGTGIHNIQFYNNYVDSEDQMQFFENNSTTACSGYPCPTEDIRIWNNVFTCTVPTQRDAVFFGGRPIIFKSTTSGTNNVLDSVYIAHNTIANTQYGIVMSGPASPGSLVATNFVAVNNIYYDGSSNSGYEHSPFTGDGSLSGSNVYWNNLGDVIVDYNLIYDNDGFMSFHRPVGGVWTKYETLSGFNAVTGDNNDGANLEGNPNFAETTNYTIGASSTNAIDKGMSLSGQPWYWSALGYDKNGITRPQGSGWDIGAYEYTTASPTAPLSPSNLIISQN